MKILVDADACPNAVKEILFRAATRTGIDLIFIANQSIKVPKCKNISSIQVSQGFDVADDEVSARAEEGDLVITSDLPLAAEVLEKGAYVLNQRGEKYTLDNIKPKLNMRDFMETMRSSGVQSGGPPPFGQIEKQKFANELDRLLTKHG